MNTCLLSLLPPRRRSLKVHLAVLALLLGFPGAVVQVTAAAPWGVPLMQPGIAAVTCAAQQKDALGNPVPPALAYPFGLLDLRTPAPTNYTTLGWTAALWNPPMYHHPDWSVAKLGCVFGIAVDSAGNLYLGAHSLYVPFWGPPFFGNPYLQLGALGGSNPTNASGTIYRIDATSGVASVFAVLPQQADANLPWNPAAGPGVGNLTYDPANDQVFATNLEDGKIYRITKSGLVGIIAQVFDPLAPDNGLPGMPPLGDRLWAIEVSGSAVFYATWNQGDAANPHVIRRVNIGTGGALNTLSDTNVLTVPATASASAGFLSTPVSDLTFSQDGLTMILAERGMFKSSSTGVFADYYAVGNHYTPVKMAKFSGGSWGVVRTLASGNNNPAGEGYGGADFGPESGVAEALVWVSSADMATGSGPHGIQGVRQTDFPLTIAQVPQSYVVPYDPGFTASGPDVKGIGADVEILPERDCSRLTAHEVACPDKPDQPFAVTIDVQNLSGVTALYGWWNPCPTNTLPPGAVTAQPLPASVFPLPGGALTNQGTVTLTAQLPAGLGGQTVCFLLTLLDDRGRVCCTQKVCVDLPTCDCARVVARKVDCHPQADGSISYTVQLTIQNLTHLSSNPFPFYQTSFVPPTGFNPANAIPSPTPIPPGGTGTITFTYVGSPGRLCFTLGLHDRDIEPCCFIPVCVDLPECGPTERPDTCALESEVLCRPGPPGTPPGTGMATINYTLCNNSSAPRTYTWSANGTSAPPCTQTLLPGDFTPPSGTVTVPAGSYTNIIVTVACRGWRPGDCASYTLCAVHDPATGQLCCEGRVRRPDGAGLIVFPITEPTGGGAPVLGPDESDVIELGIENPTSAPVKATLALAEATNLLLLSVLGSDAGQAELFVQVSLSPDGTQVLPVTVRRVGAVPPYPAVGSLVVQVAEGHWTATDFPPQPSSLRLPVLLRPGTAADPRPSILGLRLEADPTPRAVLRVAVETGRRYLVERAADPAGPWRPASVVESAPGAEGEFLAIDAQMTCQVLCEPGDQIVFLRLQLR